MLVYMLMLMAECLLCNSKLQSHSTALWCEYCSRPVHIRCIPFDKAEYQDDVKRNHGWSCTQCNDELFPVNNIDDEYEFVEALYEFINGSNIDLTVLKEKVFNPLLLNDKTTNPLFQNDPDINFYNEISSIYVDNSNYYFEDQVSKKFSKTDITKTFSILHENIRCLPAHHTEWQAFLDSIEEHFTLIGLTETWLSENNAESYSFSGYNHVFNYRDNRLGGGVSLFIDNSILFNKRDDLTVESCVMETIFIEIDKSAFQLSKNVIIGVIYRPPNTDVDDFNKRLLHIIEQINKEINYVISWGIIT